MVHMFVVDCEMLTLPKTDIVGLVKLFSLEILVNQLVAWGV